MSSYRAVYKRDMPQEFHPGVLKSWHIAQRAVFLSTSISPVNNISHQHRIISTNANNKYLSSLEVILVAHWSWAFIIFAFIYFCISISELDSDISLQLILKANSLHAYKRAGSAYGSRGKQFKINIKLLCVSYLQF